jgi:hypothetical protein
MKYYRYILLFTAIVLFLSCSKKEHSGTHIIFLHHSTGEVIWFGKPPSLFKRGLRKFYRKLAYSIDRKAKVVRLLEKYSKEQGKLYEAVDVEFPKISPYGWNNNPYDYYNIWIKHEGNQSFMEEPTLEILTKQYQVIIFKHCYPVSNIQADKDSADVNSSYRSLSNYKLQYRALRDKMHQFPDTKFILFTGAAQVKNNISEPEANRAREFFNWVTREWDIPDDNIFIWDLYNLETEGGLYFREDYASSPTDSHPNRKFASVASELLFQRIVDVIDHEGRTTKNSGENITTSE